MGGTSARGVAVVAIVAALVVLGTGCVVGGVNCEPTVGAQEAIFEGTVGAVADDGVVQLTVESVTPPTTLNTTTVVGGPTTTAAPVLATVTAGATVTVAFPAEQVEHLRRDIGERYRVRAYPDDTGDALRSQLNDFEYPCGPTKLADE